MGCHEADVAPLDRETGANCDSGVAIRNASTALPDRHPAGQSAPGSRTALLQLSTTLSPR